MEERPKYIVMHADNTFAPLFWDDEDVGIGDVESLSIGEDEMSLSDLTGLKEWFSLANKFDPYTLVTQFTIEGMDEWINKGCEFAKQLRTILPKDIDLYYGYWHQFGDNEWRYCKAYISPRQSWDRGLSHTDR